MTEPSRIGRMLGRGRADETPALAVGAVFVVVSVIVVLILAAAFTLWAILR